MIKFMLLPLFFMLSYTAAHYYIAARAFAQPAASIIIAAAGTALGIGFMFMMPFDAYNRPVLKFIMDFLSYAMAFTFYLMMLYVIADLLRLAGFYPSALRAGRLREMTALAAAAAVICIAGYANLQILRVRRMDVKTAKPGVAAKIAFISDLHIGTGGMTPEKLARAAGIINGENPDLILIGGDMVDRYVADIARGGYDSILKGFRAKHGMFAVLGNHEYYRNEIKDVTAEFERLGIRVLRDEAVRIPELGIELVGLDDPAKSRFEGAP
ncbi:MAG: metallophosphoesterase, partial [Rickettsiales bacterium]|nr:metallophosphoesterase [Rickettsiales bacterium]